MFKRAFCVIKAFLCVPLFWTGVGLAEFKQAEFPPAEFPSADKDTVLEAGFSYACHNGICKDTPQTEMEQTSTMACVAKVKSDDCQQVPPALRDKCEPSSSALEYLFKGGESLLKCAENVVESVEFLLQLVWHAIKFSSSMVFSAEQREDTLETLSSAKNYMALEFVHAYGTANGKTSTEKALNAAAQVAGESLHALWSSFKDVIVKTSNTFMCYDGATQAGIICSLVVGMIAPIPGASAFTSAKGFLTAAKLTGKTPLQVKRLIQSAIKNTHNGRLKMLSTNSKKLYKDLSQSVLKQAKNWPKSVQTEVRSFFKNPLNQKQIQQTLAEQIQKVRAGDVLHAGAVTYALTRTIRNKVSPETGKLLLNEVGDFWTTEFMVSQIPIPD